MKSIIFRFFMVVYMITFSSICLIAQRPASLSFAHAHNDYEKLFRKDFKKALAYGCSSIEIDVFFHRNMLKVSHVALFLGLRSDFEKRYLKPIHQYLRSEGNLFLNPNDKLILMIDIKREPEKTYRILRKLCQKYEDILTVRYRNSSVIKHGPLQILLSGSKPYEELFADSVRYMQLDGGLGDIGSQKFSPDLVPRVSTSYRGNFKWRGLGKISERELQFLRETSAKARADGRELRFWGMPNRLSVLNLMLKEGVYWLNIDRLRQLKKLDPETVRSRDGLVR